MILQRYKLAGELGTLAIPIALDISNSKTVRDVCDDIRKAHGDISVLVNNAGILSNSKLADTSDEEWHQIMSINLDGSFYLCREWLPSMKKQPDFLTEEQKSELLNQIPVGRFCEAEEVAHVVRFLASPLSGVITGELIDINGGLHID